MRIYQLDNEDTQLSHQYVTIPAADNAQNPSITFTTAENVATIRLTIECTNHIGQTIFIDNIIIQ